MQSFSIVNATVVLPDRVLDGGAVLVKNGLIADCRSAAALNEQPEHRIDAEGTYLLPGIVELHNDGYEFELNPRPGANIPLPLAFASFERRLVGAGVTTEFHAISFMNRPSAAAPPGRRRARQHLHRRAAPGRLPSGRSPDPAPARRLVA